MTRRRRYYWIGMALSAVGGLLVALSLAEELFSLRIFSSSPLLVGTGVGAIGIALVAGARQAEGEEGNETT